MQLPDVLPTSPNLENKDEDPAAASPKVVDVLTEEFFENTLRKLEAGRIGKLRIRKSGKMELQLGEHTLELSTATPVSVLIGSPCPSLLSGRPLFA